MIEKNPVTLCMRIMKSSNITYSTTVVILIHSNIITESLRDCSKIMITTVVTKCSTNDIYFKLYELLRKKQRPETSAPNRDQFDLIIVTDRYK